MKSILEVKNLGVTFNDEIILHDISFSVNERDIIVIVGPNGAGKTTLLRALLGFIPHTGTVTWYTKNLSYLPPHEMLHHKDIPPLTIQEFFLCKKSISKQKIPSMLQTVGLDPAIEMKQFTELSTGQFQRMLIAWALISNPSVILFDDPATAIDISGQAELYALLKKLWEKHHLTIILVTHNLNIVWEHATHVLCLNKTIICQGKPEVTLTPENLEKIYGWGVKLYEHRHDK
jgi:ABC-type Mn2+/Zn2+ transport system ATPase subunit